MDDGGNADLNEVLAERRQRLRLSLLRQENQGPAAARNLAASRAEGELLVCIDDDCRAHPQWLSKLAEAAARQPARILGGRVVNALAENPYAATSQHLLELIYEKCNRDSSKATFLTSNNMAIPAERFREMGGFDSRLRTSEDRELCDRWIWKGGKMSFVADAVVYHAHEMGFFGFCRQHFDYGRGASALHRLRRRRGSGTMRYSLEFHRNPRNWLLPTPRQSELSRYTAAALMVVLQTVNAAGFFREELGREYLPRG